jgi:hypothetical protein
MSLHYRILCTGLALGTLVGITATTSAAQPDRAKQREVMNRLVAFARDNVGKTVDRGDEGQGTGFVQAALEFAKGQPMTHVTHRVNPSKKILPLDSIGWGQRVIQLGKNHPATIPGTGCIVQFEGCRFEQDGYAWDFAHHTAIVESRSGTMVTLLHQHAGSSSDPSQVRRETIDFAGKVGGHYFVYQPLPSY